MDKDSHILFEKYVTLSEYNLIPFPKKDDDESKDKNSHKKNNEIEPRNRLKKIEDKDNYSKTYSSDDIQDDLPQDPSVKFTYSDPDSGDPLYGAKPAGRGTGEVVDPNQLSAPAPQPVQQQQQTTPQPKPNTQQQKLKLNKQTPSGAVNANKRNAANIKSTNAQSSTPTPAPQPVQQQQQPTPNVNQPSTFKNFVQGGKRGLGKALEYGLKAVDPFSKQGLLGKAATAARNAENWARSGAGDPYAAASKFIKGTGGKLDIYDKKSGIEQQKAIQNYRNTYIYPRDKDFNLNRDVANLFGKSVTVDPNTGEFIGLSNQNEQKAAGIPKYSDILKRRKPIKNAAHLANIVLDIFVDKFRQGVPPDKAYNDAFNSVGNPLIIDYLLKNKLLPKQ